MKLIIAGSRDFTDYPKFYEYLQGFTYLDQVTEIVCGMARGVDSLGLAYALEKGILVKKFHAQWDKYGKSAGPRRNIEMGVYADAAFIIINNNSRGSQNMYNIMIAQQKIYHVVVIENGETKYVAVKNKHGDTPLGPIRRPNLEDQT